METDPVDQRVEDVRNNDTGLIERRHAGQ
jgi:hypothetical protein